MTTSPSTHGLAEAFDELASRLQAGEIIAPEEIDRLYPLHAEELRKLLPTLKAIGDITPSEERHADLEQTEATPRELGDFRIVREVGRGGMGIVYEAEQLSLGRRVALKVLPFAATMDPRHLHRFHNEARAAASLEHPHIVPVHGVGSERGVHYYAMRIIDGRSLAELLLEQRRGPETASPRAETVAHATAPTDPAPGNPQYFRRVAEWGIQAAEALEHAHGLGIVHRDIKPGNLLIDGQGKLWVTDFGLARFGVDAGLTMTGDLVGTLRYMSPEQALAKHGLVDHRTDVYALGATLYELLTLRPAVGGSDKEEILRRIAFEDAVPLRRLSREVPPELEPSC